MTGRKQRLSGFGSGAFAGLFAVLVLTAAPARGADDTAALEQRLEEQDRIIREQNARIERLERMLEQLMPQQGAASGAEVPALGDAASTPAPQPPRGAAATEPPAADYSAATDPLAGETVDPISGGKVKAGYDPDRAFSGPLQRLRSADGQYSLGFGGVFQFDYAAYGFRAQGDNETTQSLGADLSDGARLRRAIVGFNGLFLQDWIYAFAYDFAEPGDTVEEGVRAALLIYRGLDPVWILTGLQSISAGLDSSNRSSYRTFMEEASPIGIFGFAPGTPALGVAGLYREPNFTARIGLFNEVQEERGNSDEGFGVHGRLTWAPMIERTRTLHFGLSGYWRKPTGVRGDNNVGNLQAIRFSGQPEIDVDETRFIDTGEIPRTEAYYFVGLETALVLGPWSVQAEYARVEVARKNGPDEVAFQDLSFDGYYVQASYFLTGESRNYHPRFATFWRLAPRENFSLSKGTWGAWEMAARFSHVDLDDGVDNLAGGGVRGGVADNVTLGLNWYLNPFVRVLLNYVRSDVDNLSDTGLSEGGVIDAVGLRMQVEW